MSNAVVFTGLARMPTRFRQSVSEMSDLAEKGLIDTIVFVTWEGELEEKSALKAHLVSNGVEIIEAEESHIAGQGNIWHQMKALDIGLRALPRNCHVLKTRSDTYIDKSFIRKMFSGKIDEVGSPVDDGVFEERVWVPSCAIDKPFYIFDYCFFGQKQDIQKLVNYDVRYDVYYTESIGPGTTEKRRYIHPYIDQFPFLETYLSEYCGHDYIYTDRYSFLESRINSSVYGSLLAFYYKVILSDFYVNYNPVRFKESQNRPIETLIENSFIENFRTGPVKLNYNVFCYDNSWFDAQFRETPNSDVPTHIVAGIDRSFDKWERYEINPDRMRQERSREKEFIDTTKYPDNRTVSLISDRILEPLSLKDHARTAYRKLTN